MSTHINMGTGSIWVRCHRKLLKTKFFHLILILKTKPFTKSKIEYLSFGCEGHWQYSQISIDRISLQSTKTVPDIHFRHSSSLWLFWGSQVPTSVLCLQKFFCTCARVSLKEGERASLWDLLTDLDKSSHHSLVDLNITFEELDLFNLASN